MPTQYHHGGSSFRTPADPGKKTEASKKIGQSRRLRKDKHRNQRRQKSRLPADCQGIQRHYMVTKKRYKSSFPASKAALPHFPTPEAPHRPKWMLNKTNARVSAVCSSHRTRIRPAAYKPAALCIPRPPMTAAASPLIKRKTCSTARAHRKDPTIHRPLS